ILGHGMHVKVVAGSLQINERRRREAHCAVKYSGLCGFYDQLTLYQSEMCRQRFQLVLCDPHALKLHVTHVGNITWLDGTGGGNTESSRAPQVYRIFQREGLGYEPHRHTVTDLPERCTWSALLRSTDEGVLRTCIWVSSMAVPWPCRRKLGISQYSCGRVDDT